MKIFLKNIPEVGLTLDQEIKAHEIQLPNEMFRCLKPLAVHAVVERPGNDTVTANVDVKGHYALSCVKCLKEFEVNRAHHFFVDYEVDDKTEFVELCEDIRQELIVAFNGFDLCQPECKGICSHCGVDLNKEKCECNKEDSKA